MKKVLILCAHRPGRSPSQRYRFEQYLPYLGEQGFTFTWSYLLNEKDDGIFYSQGRLFGKVFILLKNLLTRIQDWMRFSKFDIIFIQRESLFLGSAFFEQRAFRSGAKVIFDFDDSIWLADTSPGNKKWEWIKRPEKFNTALQNAHLVLAGNEYLASAARPFNANTRIIPTTIDTDVHVPKNATIDKKQLVIGWSGSISTIKHFTRLVPVLKEVKKKHPQVRFKVIADKQFTHPELEIEGVKWQADTEVDELNTFDIGLMPLPDDAWSRGKCGLKGLSYMACGIATVMSPVGVNCQIISDGRNGLLASPDEDWMKALDFLIENEKERREIGLSGRETVVNQFSVKANRHLYLGAFNHVIGA